MNQTAEDILHQVASNIHDSNLMKRYVINLAKADREKWQLSEVDKAMVKGGEKACQFIHANAEAHLVRLTSCMEWFPVAYHLADKVALVVFPVLAYYTGKYHLNDTMTLTSLTFFTLGRVQASLTLLSLTQFGRWPLCRSLSCQQFGASMNWQRTWSAERRSRSPADKPI